MLSRGVAPTSRPLVCSKEIPRKRLAGPPAGWLDRRWVCRCCGTARNGPGRGRDLRARRRCSVVCSRLFFLEECCGRRLFRDGCRSRDAERRGSVTRRPTAWSVTLYAYGVEAAVDVDDLAVVAGTSRQQGDDGLAEARRRRPTSPAAPWSSQVLLDQVVVGDRLHRHAAQRVLLRRGRTVIPSGSSHGPGSGTSQFQRALVLPPSSRRRPKAADRGVEGESESTEALVAEQCPAGVGGATRATRRRRGTLSRRAPRRPRRSSSLIASCGREADRADDAVEDVDALLGGAGPPAWTGGSLLAASSLMIRAPWAARSAICWHSDMARLKSSSTMLVPAPARILCRGAGDRRPWSSMLVTRTSALEMLMSFSADS